jgi:cytochrome c oxidase subunit I
VRTADFRTPEIGVVTDEHQNRLLALWESSSGVRGFLSTVDHKKIGVRYIVTAFIFLAAGGIEALIMRLQLAGPNLKLLTPEQYNDLFSTHGMTMIFLYAMPILSGFSNYLWPLLLGSRDMAFPRLNALGYWIYLASGLFLYAGFLTGNGPNDGWFNYVPYASRDYNPGLNQDFYALGMVFLGISTTVGAANFIVTAFRTRAPGMTINRLPIMIWGTLTASAANLIVIPAVSLAFFLLWLDRQYGTHFFDAAEGGQPLLWQHLFWIFGHPWVYAIVLPAMGMVSEGLPVFCRRPLVGYSLVALATVATMILGFGVWVHHMFATGLPRLGNSFYTAASMVIAIPTGIQIFSWIATLWLGRPRFTTPLLFVIGFIVVFVVGGLTGVMLASVPLDLQLHDTYFVVGHFHYVLIGGAVFPLLGAVYYWFPKVTGRLLDERLGKVNFWLLFVGFNVTFLPMHYLGLAGMPRRVYTYSARLGWDGLNLLETGGAVLIAVSMLLLAVNVVKSARRGAVAGANPWGADTLEWATPSPPPSFNFNHIPLVTGDHPLWDVDRLHVMRGLKLDERELVLTSVLDARPDLREPSVPPSIWPLLAAIAVGTMFITSIFTPWAVIVGAVPIAITLTAWFWPKGRPEEEGGQ